MRAALNRDCRVYSSRNTDMKLVPEAKQAHRLWSVRLAAIAAGLAALEASLPLWDGVVPDNVFAAASSIVGVCAAIARVVRQEALS